MRRHAAAIVVICASLSCSDAGGPASVATVTVTPANPTVEVLLDTIRLAATARDAQGVTITGRTATWSSTPTGGVEVLSTGRVQGFQGGAATVTATVDGVMGSTTVIVVVSVAAIHVTPTAATVPVDDSLRLSAVVTGTGGLAPTNGTVSWASTDTTRATVSGNGLVTARSPGSVLITAGAGTKADTASITVTP